MPSIHEPSFNALPTSEVTLRPSYIQELKRVAPRKKRAVVAYLALVLFLGLAGTLAGVPSTRHAVVARARGLLQPSTDGVAAGAPTPSTVALDPSVRTRVLPDVASVGSVVPSPLPATTASASSSEGASEPSKPAAKPRRRHARTK